MMQPGQQMQSQKMVVEPVMMTQPLQNNTSIDPGDMTPDKPNQKRDNKLKLKP